MCAFFFFFTAETITGHTSTQICLCVTFSRCHPVEYLHGLFSQTKEPTWMPLFKSKLRWIRCLSCCAPAGLLARPYLLTTSITACHDPAHQVHRQNTGSQMSHLSRRVTESIFSAHRFIIAPIITAVLCVGGNAILVGKSVLHQVLCLHWSGGNWERLQLPQYLGSLWVWKTTTVNGRAAICLTEVVKTSRDYLGRTGEAKLGSGNNRQTYQCSQQVNIKSQYKGIIPFCALHLE